MTVAVVICTYNRPELLERCLASLACLHRKADRIVVVDNGPSNETRSVAAQARADYVVAPIRGLSRARNVGLRFCTEDVISFVDDDMVFHPEWLTELTGPFVNPAVAVTTGPVLLRELESASAETLAEQLRHQPWGPFPFAITRRNPDWFERANFGGLGDGNFAIRRLAIKDWKGFDERIGRGMPLDIGEDHYAFFQFLSRGEMVAYAPGAIVFHPTLPGTAERRVIGLTQSLAYVGFVAIENPAYALRVLSYFVGGLYGRRRSWRVWSSNETPYVRMSSLVALRCLAAAIGVLGKCYAVSQPNCQTQSTPQRARTEGSVGSAP